MATYEIKNYIKLLCLRVDHFESFIVAEENTNSMEDIENFISRYDNREGLKVIIIQMDTMETITFDEVRKIIHNAHVFDYIRHLLSEGHKILNVTDTNKLELSWLINHMIADVNRR